MKKLCDYCRHRSLRINDYSCDIDGKKINQGETCRNRKFVPKEMLLTSENYKQRKYTLIFTCISLIVAIISMIVSISSCYKKNEDMSRLQLVEKADKELFNKINTLESLVDSMFLKNNYPLVPKNAGLQKHRTKIK
jgi:hypothetical protein